MTVAAAEAAIGLAIIVVYYRNSGTIRVEEIDKEENKGFKLRIAVMKKDGNNPIRLSARSKRNSIVGAKHKIKKMKDEKKHYLEEVIWLKGEN